MNPLMLIKGELRRSFGGILALALVLALSLSLGVGVSMTERAVRAGHGAGGRRLRPSGGRAGQQRTAHARGGLSAPAVAAAGSGGRGYGNPDAGRRRLGRAAGLRRPLERVPAGGDDHGYGHARRQPDARGRQGVRRTGRSRTRRGCPPAARRGVFPHARAGLRIPQRTRTCPLQGRRPPAGNGHAVGQRHPHSHRIGLGRPRCASRCGAWPAPRASF